MAFEPTVDPFAGMRRGKQPEAEDDQAGRDDAAGCAEQRPQSKVPHEGVNSMSRVISFVQHGDFKKSLTFMTRARSRNVRGILEKYGQRGVEALAIATPKATGKTAASWSYEIKMDDNGATLCWKNANIVDGVPIAVIRIQKRLVNSLAESI